MFQRAENALNNGRSIGVESETGIIFQLADSTIESCDLVAERLLGYSAKQLVGTTLFEPVWQAIYPDGSVVAPEDYPAHVALRQGLPCRNVVMGFYKPSGDLVWLRLNSTPLFQGDTTTSYAVITTFSEVASSQQNEPQLEPTLRSSEQRFRDMADNAPMMIWVTDPTGYCTYLSRSWYDFSGQTEEAGLGFGWLDVTHPDDRESSKIIFLAANARQEAFQLEYRLRRFDGEYRTCIDAGRPWKSADGEFKGYIGSVIDIDDRKLAESALRRSEERYRTLFESIDEGFCVIEVLFDENDTPLDYRFLEINPVFEQQTGLRQAVGKTARQLVPDLEDHWIKIYGQVALTGESVRFENGSEAMNRWFDVYTCRTGQPEERKVAIVFKDISDRKLAEKALLLSEEQSRNILESITDAFFALDQDWRFTYVNRQAEHLLERASGDLIGKNFWSEFPGLNGSEFEQLHRRVMSDRVAASLTAFYPDHNRWYEVRTYPAAKGVTTYFRNVTDRVSHEAEREQLLQREQTAREAAETANRIKDEFLAVLSHELRSPLNPILGWSKLLQQGKLDAAKTKIALATIERNAKLQSQLIEDLLDISRILRGKLSLNVMPVDLSMVILAALETVRLAAEAKSLHIQTTLSPDVGKVIGDAGRLQQVVWNLLSNAVKFTFQGGQITVTLTQTGTDAQIQVTDTGKGINPDFLPYVFEHFRQEDGATTRKFGGLGLGLAIARQIVELHGGIIWVESPGEDQGATFTVQIPLAFRFSELPSTEQSSVSTSDLSGIHILVVDDDADSRDFITFVLEQAGAIVTAVASAIEALQAFKQSVFDLVVSDIGMPEMDGYALIQQIRALEPARLVPAIALTAYAGEIDQQQAIAAGFQAHIAKPVDPNAAIAIVVQFTKRLNAKERSPD
ncbi:PAS domain S-box protein [Tolypothrix sp. VBCCA 56010]|uniref:PAS domain-containing hybrid sensor histidine kinase/response regulator n=1 Tax=Tolypothrix sp. VBCCA 56010 TaxID=3137731 RepID=UPI003D7E6A23